LAAGHARRRACVSPDIHWRFERREPADACLDLRIMDDGEVAFLLVEQPGVGEPAA
jgi:hypothetical protein